MELRLGLGTLWKRDLRSLMEELINQILKELCDYFSVDIVICERINIIEIQSL